MLARPLILLGAITGAWLVTTTVPNAAHACSQSPCPNLFFYMEMVEGVVATDGVLRFDARWGRDALPEDYLPFIDVQVTDPEGATIDGALEYHDSVQTLVWRPATPLSPQTTYDTLVVIDKDALTQALGSEDFDEECIYNDMSEGRFQTSEDPLPTVALPDPQSTWSHDVFPSYDSLASQVCCDEAYPYEESNDAACGEITVEWDQGDCSTSEATGWLLVEQSFSETDFDPHTIYDLVVAMVVTDRPESYFADPGTLSAYFSAPEAFCAALEVTSLSTGERWLGPEYCYGDEVLDTLGLHSIDPSEDLAMCATPPYTCEVDGSAWDPDACDPWDSSARDDSPQDDPGVRDPGCTCRTQRGGSTTLPWLVLAVLGAGRFRRRAGRSPGKSRAT